MQDVREKEAATLQKLRKMEELAQKKISIFSRILMDVALAQDLEALATRHSERKETLSALLGETPEDKQGEEE